MYIIVLKFILQLEVRGLWLPWLLYAVSITLFNYLLASKYGHDKDPNKIDRINLHMRLVIGIVGG